MVTVKIKTAGVLTEHSVDEADEIEVTQIPDSSFVEIYSEQPGTQTQVQITLDLNWLLRTIETPSH